MQRRGLSVVFTALLAGCGGGGIQAPHPLDIAGADVPASLTAPSDAAKAAAALTGFINLTGGLTLQGSFSGTGAKATTTTPCDLGSRTFTTDDSTPFAGDGRTQFDECTQIVTDGSQEQGRTITDGVRQTRCHDTTNSSQCQDESGTSGENNQPISFQIITPSSNQRLQALGSGRETTSGDRSASGAEQFDNLINHKSATLVFDQILMFSTAGSGDRSTQIAGTYGLNDMARATANCLSGRLTVSTTTPLHIDGNENFTGGQLHFASDDGSSGDVTFLSDGSVSARVGSGTPQMFSAAQFRQFCSIQ
jgi:hypothetical protein